MNIALQNSIIEKIKMADENLLLKIKQILDKEPILSNHLELPIEVNNRLNNSIKQADSKNYLEHETVMEKFRQHT